MVYGVFSGCYSDWSVHGYFNSKEDADKYCCVCNKNGEYDNYYVKPLENLENEIDLSSISLKYEYCIVFTKRNSMKNGIKSVPQYSSCELDYQCYTGDEFRYNKIEYYDPNTTRICVNIDSDDYKFSSKNCSGLFCSITFIRRWKSFKKEC